jgi:hypothetical protein
MMSKSGALLASTTHGPSGSRAMSHPITTWSEKPSLVAALSDPLTSLHRDRANRTGGSHGAEVRACDRAPN